MGVLSTSSVLIPWHPSCSFDLPFSLPLFSPPSLPLFYPVYMGIVGFWVALTLTKYKTFVSLSCHCLGPHECPSSPGSVYIFHTLCQHMFSTCRSGAEGGQSPPKRADLGGCAELMQSRSWHNCHVLSPFNCLSQRVHSLFNFPGILKQLSMFPGVPLLLESAFFFFFKLSLYV